MGNQTASHILPGVRPSYWKSIWFEIRRPYFKCQFCHLPAEWISAIYLHFLGLGVLTCNIGMIMSRQNTEHDVNARLGEVSLGHVSVFTSRSFLAVFLLFSLHLSQTCSRGESPTVSCFCWGLSWIFSSCSLRCPVRVWPSLAASSDAIVLWLLVLLGQWVASAELGAWEWGQRNPPCQQQEGQRLGSWPQLSLKSLVTQYFNACLLPNKYYVSMLLLHDYRKTVESNQNLRLCDDQQDIQLV